MRRLFVLAPILCLAAGLNAAEADSPAFVLTRGVSATAAASPQGLSRTASPFPAISQSIHATEKALKALERARADMGGHKEKAAKHLNAALKELKAGLAVAKPAPGKKASKPKPAAKK